MRGLLVDMKKGHPGQEEGLRTCWQTLLKMCGNVYNSPGGCCAGAGAGWGGMASYKPEPLGGLHLLACGTAQPPPTPTPLLTPTHPPPACRRRRRRRPQARTSSGACG